MSNVNCMEEYASSLNPVILLALLNYFEEYNEKNLTQSVDEMRQDGIKDLDSLENYLKKKFCFDYFDNVNDLKDLFDRLLLDNPTEDIMPLPIDAVIKYDSEGTMSIKLNVYVNVFMYKKVDLTFKSFSAELSKVENIRQVADILWEVTQAAREISKHITACDNFQISLWHGKND